MRFVVLFFAFCFVGACNGGEGDANDLAASSEVAARDVVNAALVALAAGDVEGVVARFCDQSDEGRALAREIVTPASGKRDLAIVRSEAAWKGAVPFFYVEVAERGAGAHGFVHGFGVRVRDGCLDRAVGATVLPDPRHAVP